MSCITCPRCNLVNWKTEPYCKRCSHRFDANEPQPTYERRDQAPYDQQYDYRSAYAPQRGGVDHRSYNRPGLVRTGLAIASMVIGIISLPTSFLLIGLFLAPIALILGIVAVLKASRKPMEYGGKGFAIAGIATSSTALLFVVPLIAAIAIPNLLAARRAANEASAISSLRTIHSAQRTFVAMQQVCGELTELGAANLIDKATAEGKRNGYRFEVSKECSIHATPLSSSDGSRSFMISYAGVTYAAKKHGLKADENDPELGR